MAQLIQTRLSSLIGTESDWDLVEQIYSTTTPYPPKFLSYHWVQGHQDTTADNVPIEVQFNIRADTLAAQAYHPRKTPTTKQPFLLPTTKCLLEISDQSIHAYYIMEIRKAYTVPKLMQYLTARHQWPAYLIQAIDWKAFCHAAQNPLIPKTQLTKLVYDKLPTKYEKSKSQPTLRTDCPHCGACETFLHLLSCHNVEAQKFRQDLIDHIEMYFHRHACPAEFRRRFLLHQRQWYTERACEQESSPTSDRTTTGQALIGWNLVLKGFLSMEWRHLLLRSQSQDGTTTLQSTTRFLAGIIQIFWDSQIAFWNRQMATEADNHCHTSQRYQDRHLELATKIRLLHERKHMVLQAHRDSYFFDHVETFLANANLAQLQAYLHNYEPAIEASVRAARQVITQPLTAFPGFTRMLTTASQSLRLRVSPNSLPVLTRTSVVTFKDRKKSKPRPRDKSDPSPFDLRHYFRVSTLQTTPHNDPTLLTPTRTLPQLLPDPQCTIYDETTHAHVAQQNSKVPLSDQVLADDLHSPPNQCHHSIPLSLHSEDQHLPHSTDHPRLRNTHNMAGAFPRKHSKWKWSSPLNTLRQLPPDNTSDPTAPL